MELCSVNKCERHTAIGAGDCRDGDEWSNFSVVLMVLKANQGSDRPAILIAGC